MVRLAVYTHRLDVAVRVAALLTMPARPDVERALGFRALASVTAAQGQWRESRAYTDSMRVLDPHYALETQARLATVPFAPYGNHQLEVLHDALLRWSAVRARDHPRWITGWYAPREYPKRMTAVAGLLAVGGGDLSHLRAAAKAFRSDTAGAEPWREWQRDRSALLRAEILRREGRTNEAIGALTNLRPPDDWGSRDEERLLLAELFRDAGRLPEAIREFGTFEQMSTEDLPWAAPAHFMRAELLEKLGRAAEAEGDYDRVAELWQNCDPELRPMLEDARRRAVRLHAMLKTR
jgi:hypothetical protein